ncbi:centromere protein T [Leptodactylus fuscus]|uniref:centromere protein T n=1 Tax=Leptodactylus fuscus TaxID=238119 RepID=UPI003F4E67FC
MEDSSEDNLTTRSLLKGILATEPVRTAVKKQSKKRVNQQPSTSYAHQDENVSSPSMNLRNKMKDRVRRSLRKSTLETSVLKRNAEASSKTKPKSAKKGSHPIMEDLDNITPRTLLKKIIQNEDEVSIIVSQRPKSATDEDKNQENTPTAKLSSVGSINLSLPDLQDTEKITVFKKSRKKRKMRVSEFEREVDERLPKNKDNDNISHDKSDVPSLFTNSYSISGSLENRLDVSAAPESTFKRGLLRRPNKICLVSLGDFEQGVEDKYQQLKGSQECFIEEDKSDSLSNEVAEMETELYGQSLRKEANASKSDRKQRGASHLVSSTYAPIKEASSERMETETSKLKRTDRSMSESPKEGTSKDIGRVYGRVITDSDDEEMNEDREEAETGSDISETGGDIGETEAGDDIGEAGDDIAETDDDISDTGEAEAGDDIGEAGDDIGEAEAGGDIGEAGDDIAETDDDISETGGDIGETEAGEDIGEAGDDIAETDDDISETGGDTGEAEAGDDIGEAGDDIGEAEAAGDEFGEAGKDIGETGDDISEAGDDSGEDEAGDVHVEINIQPNKSRLANSNRKSRSIGEYFQSMHHTRLGEENVAQKAESVRVHTISVSRPEQSSEYSESSDDENVDLAQSARDTGMARKKENNQLMLSALPETPDYMKSVRFVNKDKPAISKKIQRTKSTMPKKQGAVFTSRLVKQIFNHHAQVRVSKEALVDVEKCLDRHMDQLAADLSTYTAHANRKTITRADMELLMKRQRLVTDTTSLNVLIEKHLPLECRTLLIPCAMSGNKVFPKM